MAYDGKRGSLCLPTVFSSVSEEEARRIDGGADAEQSNGGFWSWFSWLNPATWFGTSKVSTSWYISWSGKSLGEGITKDSTLGAKTGEGSLWWRVLGWVITQFSFNYRISRS